MKDKRLKAISIVLGLILMFTFFVACNPSDTDGNGNKNSSTYADNSANHISEITTTNEYVVNNNTSAYVLIYPQSMTKYLSKAVTEFKHLFLEATGVSLNAMPDTGITHDAEQKYISIGKTQLFKSTGITIESKNLGDSGHIIQTKDKNIYLVGQEDKGSLYAVYTFMEKAFNFDAFFLDTYHIDKVTNFKLYNYNVLEKPDIAHRAPGTIMESRLYSDYDARMYYDRLRMNQNFQDVLMPIHESEHYLSRENEIHNTSRYFPENVYKEAHPKWFSTGGEGELCYTARGDEAELEAMATEAAKRIQYSLTIYNPVDYPDYKYVTFSKGDVRVSCSCNACLDIAEKYGAASAAPIILVNKIGAKVGEWMEKPENAAYYRENFKVVFFAYHHFTDAPVTYNETTKSYDRLDDNIVFNDYAGVMYCPIRTFDYASHCYDDVNIEATKSIEAWSSLCQNSDGGLILWTYGTSFVNPLLFFDSFNFYENDWYRLLYTQKIDFDFVERQTSQRGALSVFESFKEYMHAKLSWNCNLDVNELTDRWFNGMYGNAAPYVREYFDALRLYSRKTVEDNGLVIPYSTYNQLLIPKYWSYGVLNSWIDMFDKAFNALETYKTTDYELYEKYYRNVGQEYLSPANFIVRFCSTSMTPSQKEQVSNLYNDIVAFTGIKNLA